MKIKNLIDEDFCNYKKPSMFIGTSTCNFKCDKECGRAVCQNSALAAAPTIEIDSSYILTRFFKNPVTEAIVIGGLEPFDDYLDGTWKLLDKINYLLYEGIITIDDIPEIIIYTGYYPNEIKEHLRDLNLFSFANKIMIKFGRFIPDQKPHYDELLGINLASDNQYAMKLEDLINEISELE